MVKRSFLFISYVRNTICKIIIIRGKIKSAMIGNIDEVMLNQIWERKTRFIPSLFERLYPIESYMCSWSNLDIQCSFCILELYSLPRWERKTEILLWWWWFVRNILMLKIRTYPYLKWFHVMVDKRTYFYEMYFSQRMYILLKCDDLPGNRKI